MSKGTINQLHSKVKWLISMIFRFSIIFFVRSRSEEISPRVQSCKGDQDKRECKHHNPYGLDWLDSSPLMSPFFPRNPISSNYQSSCPINLLRTLLLFVTKSKGRNIFWWQKQSRVKNHSKRRKEEAIPSFAFGCFWQTNVPWLKRTFLSRH